MVRRSVNSTSSTDARNRGGAVKHNVDLDRGRNDCGHFGQESFDPPNRLDDVGVRLLVDGERDSRLGVVKCRRKSICGCSYGVPDIADPHRRTVSIGQDNVVEPARVRDLVVGFDCEALPGGGQRTLWGIGRRGHQRAADVFERQSARSELGGINLYADRRFLLAADGDLGDARHLRDLLREIVIRVFVNTNKRHRRGVRRKYKDRSVGGIKLLIGRWRGHGLWQCLAGRRDCRLHVLRGQIDVAVKIELNRDRRSAKRTERRHLGDAGDLSELPFERGRHRRSHGFGSGTRQCRADLDCWEIDLRQRCDRQQPKRRDADKNHCSHQQRSCYRTADEGRGDIHLRSTRASKGGIRLMPPWMLGFASVSCSRMCLSARSLIGCRGPKVMPTTHG